MKKKSILLALFALFCIMGFAQVAMKMKIYVSRDGVSLDDHKVKDEDVDSDELDSYELPVCNLDSIRIFYDTTSPSWEMGLWELGCTDSLKVVYFDNGEISESMVIQRLNRLYRTLNAYDRSEWGFTPQIHTNGYSTLDVQPLHNINDTSWTCLPQFCTGEERYLEQIWNRCYLGIYQCNQFLQWINEESISEHLKNTAEGEARALRGFYYFQLATTFGKVPLWTAAKSAYAAEEERPVVVSYDEIWNFIIADFKSAERLLNWQPYNDEYLVHNVTRCTKGMALAYLGDAYMWKATADNSLYSAARDCFKKVIDANVYELSPCFASLWDYCAVSSRERPNEEVIFGQFLMEDDPTGQKEWAIEIPLLPIVKYTACPTLGGTGMMQFSWELYASYESGDKRREASMVTGEIGNEKLEKYVLASQTTCGINPYTKDVLDDNTFFFKQLEKWDRWDAYAKDPQKYKNIGENTHYFHFVADNLVSLVDSMENKEIQIGKDSIVAPTIYCLKYWRGGYADEKRQSYANIYWKRYANVLLDYAECCFRTGNAAEGWVMINKLRNRAWGNLEVGIDNSNYLTDINRILLARGKEILTEYPIPYNTFSVEAISAEEYYTAQCNIRGYNLPVWQVAINEERRKEFAGEWCLRPDLQKSGYLEEHINKNYPQTQNKMFLEDFKDYPWTERQWELKFVEFYPIPTSAYERKTSLGKIAREEQ